MVTLNERLQHAREALNALDAPTPPALRAAVRTPGHGRFAAVAASLVIVAVGLTVSAVLVSSRHPSIKSVDTVADTTAAPTTPSITEPAVAATSTTEPSMFERIPTEDLTGALGPLQINPGTSTVNVAASEGQTLTIASSNGNLCLNWTLPSLDVAMASVGCYDYPGIAAFVNERSHPTTRLVAPFDITILAPDNTQLAVLNKDGSEACDLKPTPIPEIGAITVWICTGNTPAQGWDLRFTQTEKTFVSDFPHSSAPQVANPLPAIGDPIPVGKPIRADWVMSIVSDTPWTADECPPLIPVSRDGIIIGYIHNNYTECGHQVTPGPTIIYDAKDNPIGTFINGEPVLNSDTTPST